MMNPTLKIMRPPQEKGFMRNGFFAWPATLFKCPGVEGEGCGVEFESYTGTVQRCHVCREKHYKLYQKEFGKTRRAKK